LLVDPTPARTAPPPGTGPGPTPRAPTTVDDGPGTAPVSLEASYELCRALHRRHGTTYYWATRALPRIKQHHVHALYGLCRYADEIVDALDDGAGPVERGRTLPALRAELLDGLERRSSRHPVLRAVVHTALAFDLEPALFERFFAAMARDLTVTQYETYDDLMGYMDGSAAVIGELMLPILEPVDPAAALPGARDLGVAFQLTNFLRDVGEDLDRGRVYLPQEDLRRFGADPWRRQVDEPWRALCRFEIDRIRSLYRSADAGVAHLPPRSAAGIRAARVLYAEILDRIEANGYDVFSQRARVPTGRKLRVAARELIRRGRR
jgi:15-cis-phytoene synthase